MKTQSYPPWKHNFCECMMNLRMLFDLVLLKYWLGAFLDEAGRTYDGKGRR
jgi:hypothetical protein